MSMRQPDDEFRDVSPGLDGDAGFDRERDAFEFGPVMAEVGTTLAGILLVIAVLLLCIRFTGYG